jgi:hypothetical protein
MFSSYLEFQMTDEVHKPSDSEYYTPLPEPFRFYKGDSSINNLLSVDKS